MSPLHQFDCGCCWWAMRVDGVFDLGDELREARTCVHGRTHTDLITGPPGLRFLRLLEISAELVPNPALELPGGRVVPGLPSPNSDLRRRQRIVGGAVKRVAEQMVSESRQGAA